MAKRDMAFRGCAGAGRGRPGHGTRPPSRGSTDECGDGRKCRQARSIGAPGLTAMSRSGWKSWWKKGLPPGCGLLLERQGPDIIADDTRLPLALARRALEHHHVRLGQGTAEGTRIARGKQVARPVAAEMGTPHPEAGQHG